MDGAYLPHPESLLNDELGGKQRRAIKLKEGDTINEGAFKALVRMAIVHNQAKVAAKNKP